jgi:hypothetical protein
MWSWMAAGIGSNTIGTVPCVVTMHPTAHDIVSEKLTLSIEGFSLMPDDALVKSMLRLMVMFMK